MVSPMLASSSLTLSTASGSFRAHSRASVCASSAWSSGRSVLKNFRKIVRKVVRVQIVMSRAVRPRNLPALLSPHARIKLDFKRRHRKTSHSKDTTSAMNISSIISTGFTAAQIRARSWS